MKITIKIGSVAILAVGLVMAAAVWALFHGYFDHGLFEIKQVEWSPLGPRRVAMIAERSDHQAMSSNTCFVLIADHVFSATELRRAYHSDEPVFAAANGCLRIRWKGPDQLIVDCQSGIVDQAHIDVRKPSADDVTITYVNIDDSTAKDYNPVF